MPALLLVSYYFPPHAAVGAKRALRIASHLTRLGWSVQVLTVKEAYSQPLDPSLLDDDPVLDVIRTPALHPKRLVRRLRSLLRGPSAQPSQHRPSAANSDGDSPSARPLVSILWDSLFSIPDEFAGWLPFALLAGRLRARRPDAVLATSPPFTCAVLGLLLAGLFRSPLILDYRDPWTASTRIRHLPRWRQKFDTTIERLSLRRAALTITTSEAIGAAVIRLGARRTRVIPNTFDLKLLSKSPPTRYSRFTIVYAGVFYKSRSAEPILRAIAHLRNSG